MKIEALSATRVDLAGGTLDCWPIYLLLDEPITVNIGLNLYTKATLTARADQKVFLHSVDRKVERLYTNLSEALEDREPAFELVRWHLRYWSPRQGFDLQFGSESPIGAGLGGSSSLCISLLKVFSRWMGEHLEDDAMVRLAANLEAQVLRKPTGTQDYYPALRGGLCVIQYGPKGPQCKRTKTLPSELSQRLLLIHTGRVHHSGLNNWEVIKAVLDGDPAPLEALRDIAAVSRWLSTALSDGRFDSVGPLLDQETEARLRLSSSVGCPEFEAIRMIAKCHRASVKICGAGGGGTVLIWMPSQADSSALKSELAGAGFRSIEAQPWAEDG